MCAPAIALGAVSAASGIAGSVGQYQSAQAQADAANASTMRQWRDLQKRRKTSWQRESLRYDYQKLQYEQETSAINESLGRAYSGQQLALNEKFKQAAFNNQAQVQQLLKLQGLSAAAGRTGRSNDRLDATALAQFGRNQAIKAESLASARKGYLNQVDNLRFQAEGDRRRAFSSVAMQPVPGVAPSPPVMQSGPGALGLISGIGSALATGYGTYNDLKAPTTAVPNVPV